MLLQLRKNLVLKEDPSNGTILLSSSQGNVVCESPSFLLKECIQKLLLGAKGEDLIEEVAQKEGERGLLLYYYLLEKLRVASFLTYSINFQDRIIAQLVPYTKNFLYEPKETLSKYQLSPFYFCRLIDGEMVVETPLCPAGVILKDKIASLLLHALHKPLSWAELSQQFPEIPSATIRDFIELLVNAKVLSETEGEKDPVFSQWEFHDLLFHTRSRLGRHANPLGGLFPHLGKIPSLPASKPPRGERIPLYIPDIAELKENDASLTSVMEERKSKRTKGPLLTAKALGEFLYRTSRIQSFRSEGQDELSSRIYPGGGARYELEIYPVIHSCEGLSRGLYHYEPKNHQLEKWADPDRKMEELLTAAKFASGKEEFPQILFVIAARFQRMSWKYQSIAYATILKDVGVLMQTFYLVATAMHLSPSSIGCGDADLFAEVASLNYYEETSVGEFILS